MRLSWRTERVSNNVCPAGGCSVILFLPPAVTDEHKWNSASELESRRTAVEEKYNRLTKGLSLSMCYCACIGGTATLVGTNPKIILQGQIEKKVINKHK